MTPEFPTPTEADSARQYLQRLPKYMVQNTFKILDHEDAILQVNPDLFEVLSLRTPSRRVRVRRRGDDWRCTVDKKNNQDAPCSHILAVRIYEGEVQLPNATATVWKKGDAGRNHRLEEQAWKLMPTLYPELLASLLRQALPVIAPEPEPSPLGGRPTAPLFAQVYQAVMRTGWRQSLRTSQGFMDTLDSQRNNPYGCVGRSTISRFLANPAHERLLEMLLALTTWPARPYETLVHPDGTGLTEQHFTAFFEEKHHKKGERREHRWNFCEVLWTYKFTMVAAIRTQRGPFGEAPWLIPLMERAKIMLDIGELGGDKAYDANYIFQYARENGIDAQIKIRDNANPTHSYHAKKARKAKLMEKTIDPDGYAAKANRRNNAETGNHAFKQFLGDQIYSKDPIAQRNEILCMAISYNLVRLIFLSIKEGIEIQFAGGIQALQKAEWVSLETLYRRHKVKT